MNEFWAISDMVLVPDEEFPEGCWVPDIATRYTLDHWSCSTQSGELSKEKK